MKKILICCFIFSSQMAFSAIVGQAKVKGIIVAYDKKTVTLYQSGQKVKVPRTSIPSHFKIKGGNEVYALFDGEKIMKKLKK